MPSSEAPHNTCVLLTSIHSIQFLLFNLPIFLQVIKVVEVNQFDILNGSPWDALFGSLEESLEGSLKDPCIDPCDQDPHNQTNHKVTSETTCPPSPSVFGTISKATGM